MKLTVARITAAAAAGGVLAAVLGAGSAFAHVEVSADKAQAGATDVTVTFNGEAESGSAGIKSERVILPAGITPADVTLAKAPTGWTLTTAADGFTVAGPALGVGKDAVFAVKIAKLPDTATELVFKTLETYSDGTVSRWIEVPQTGKAEPDKPAPVLKLKPAAVKPSPTTAAADQFTSASPSNPASPPATSSPATAQAVDASDQSSMWPGIIVLAVVVAAGLGTWLYLWRRRRV